MEFIEYDVVDNVGVITLNRPEKANAQNMPLVVELNDAWQAAAEDDDVRVILVQANGRHFSAGHDLAGRPAPVEGEPPPPPFTLSNIYDREAKHYFDFTMSWRNVPKPSIAAVQGKCVAAGMMLCWPCDLIIAADNAEFSDPTARMGLAGVEYMAHMWEFGPRKAKEILFRSTPVTAQEAMDLGMVSKVVPLDDLREEAMVWARDVATLDPVMTRLIKRGINAQLDTAGFTASLAHSFDIHELAHGMQMSAMAAGLGGRPNNILEHMRETNKNISEREVAPSSN